MQIEHSEFQDQLVRGLTHKMNNILSLFHGYLGLLLENKQLDPAIVTGLARIKEGAKAASDLMDRTTALARPSSVVWRPVMLRGFLEMSQSFFDSLCADGVKVKVECPADIPPVWTDLSRLRTALVEVVRN